MAMKAYRLNKTQEDDELESHELGERLVMFEVLF